MLTDTPSWPSLFHLFASWRLRRSHRPRKTHDEGPWPVPMRQLKAFKWNVLLLKIFVVWENMFQFDLLDPPHILGFFFLWVPQQPYGEKARSASTYTLTPSLEQSSQCKSRLFCEFWICLTALSSTARFLRSMLLCYFGLLPGHPSVGALRDKTGELC